VSRNRTTVLAGLALGTSVTGILLLVPCFKVEWGYDLCQMLSTFTDNME
jgi:hypothetical protein